ncbi:MAG: rRNA maturation RNase YbeY [Bacteroidota bacterium]|nr:rRNA maturation RNase YbeY [Bacteroidota bacterium]
MAIHFYNEDIDFKLKNKSKLKSWIKQIIELEKKTLGTLNYIFTSDEELLKKNIQFLNHNTLTDIITFDYCEDKQLNSDIFISVERVNENAKKFEVTFQEELHRVIIHGALHLCGYKDKTKPDAETMRKKENWALRKFNPL